jgi:hypothetical protein
MVGRGSFTVIENAGSDVAPALLKAVMTMLSYTPGVVGIPSRVPGRVEVSKVSPGGREPEMVKLVAFADQM